MSSEAVNTGVELHKEEICLGSDRYIRGVDTPDGRRLRSTNEVFRQHFRNRFTKELGLCGDEFRSYLADVPRLSSTEAAGCEGEITEGRSPLRIEEGLPGQVPGS